MRDNDDLLEECWMLIFDYIELQNSRLRIQARISYLVKNLYGKFDVSRGEIIFKLYEIFKKRERHLKYDSSRSPLELYVAHFVLNELKTLICKCQKKREKRNEIVFSQLPHRETVSTIGRSIDPYEKAGLEGLVNPHTPEDYIIYNQLMDFAGRYFGQTDLEVLLGISDRKTTAEKLGRNYYCYCKRLARKVDNFRRIIKRYGYSL